MFWRCILILVAVWAFVWWLSMSVLEVPPARPVKFHLHYRPSVPVYPREDGQWRKVSEITEV